MTYIAEKTYRPAVIIFDEKHDRQVLSALTEEDLYKSCLKVLTQRFKEGYWYYDPRLEERTIKSPSLSLEQAKALPEGEVKNMALREWKTYDREQAAVKEDLKAFEQIKFAVKSKDGKLAYKALMSRRDYEYEGFDICKIG